MYLSTIFQRETHNFYIFRYFDFALSVRNVQENSVDLETFFDDGSNILGPVFLLRFKKY